MEKQLSEGVKSQHFVRNSRTEGAETHLLSQTATILLRDSLGHRHGGDTTGLRTTNLPPGGVTRLC